MSAELIITVIIAVLWYIHTSHKERQAAERLAKLKTVVAVVEAIATAPPEDSETVRKAAILARIAKVGIYQCDGSNIHLR